MFNVYVIIIINVCPLSEKNTNKMKKKAFAIKKIEEISSSQKIHTKPNTLNSLGVSSSVMSNSATPSPGSSVHGILQARILELVDIPFYGTWVSHIAGRLFTIRATREALN